MTNKEFKTNYGAIEIELAEISAHGTINDLTAWYERNIKWATGLTQKQHDAVMALYEAAYDLIRLEKGGKEMPEEIKNEVTEEVTEEVTTEETKPEVLKGEVIDRKEEKKVAATIERVSKKIDAIGKGYLAIVGDVTRLYDLKAWKYTGHKDLYQLCADKFGMARGTVSNLRKIFERFGNRETYQLTDECKEMSLRQMLATIKAEDTAQLEDKNGGAGEGDGDGNGGEEKTSKKPETLVSIDFELVGDGWDAKAIVEKLAEQLEAACADLTLGNSEKVQLTIVR